MKQILPFLLMLLAACHQQPKQTPPTAAAQPAGGTDTGYVWTKVLDSAAWRKNYNFQLFGLSDTIWTFHPDGNRFSVDGAHWTKSPLPNAINNLAFLDYVYFKGAMYGLGHFEGNIDSFHFSPAIYRTHDFIRWDTIARQSNLPNRFFYHPFVFADKIWIIGGEDKNGQYADSWNSTDGIHWAKQPGQVPFGKRSGSLIVELNHQLYLLNNDVWRSTDGLHWELVTDAIVQGQQIFGYAALVFDGKIWLLGCNRNGQFSSQVLSSSDGKNWQAHEAPWLPRGGIAATVYKNKIYITGGKYGGTPNHPHFRYDNDVWTMEKR